MGGLHKWSLIALAFVCVLAATGYFGWLAVNRGTGRGGTSTSAVAIGGPFELITSDGRLVTEQDFRGKPMLIFFGYSFCPDVCPTELQKISEALDLLGADAKKLHALFITIDPARDTAAVLRDYISNFHPNLVALGGSAAQVSRAAKNYRVYFARSPNGPGERDGNDKNYLMDHSAYIFLMDGQNRYLAHFSPSSGPKTIAQKVRQAF